MKRKHSVFLGIAYALGILYIGYLGYTMWDAYDSLTQNGSQETAALFALLFAGTLLIPHLLFIMIASLLSLIAWIRDSFTLSLISIIFYSISVFFKFNSVIFILAIVITMSIGCYTAAKHKQHRLEEEEERRYRKAHPQIEPARQNRDYAQRQLQQSSLQMPAYEQDFMQTSNERIQPMYPQMFQNDYTTPIEQIDPYAPLSQIQPQTIQYTYEQPNAVQPIYDPYTGQLLTSQGQMQNMEVASPMQSKIQDGYFDDYGNFHPNGDDI